MTRRRPKLKPPVLPTCEECGEQIVSWNYPLVEVNEVKICSRHKEYPRKETTNGKQGTREASGRQNASDSTSATTAESEGHRDCRDG